MPSAWRSRFGSLEKLGEVPIELADQSRTTGEIYGPIRLQLDGFRPIFTEVLFVAMNPFDGGYGPLLGYIPLEQSLAIVDLVAHRLVPAKVVDMKRAA